MHDLGRTHDFANIRTQRGSHQVNNRVDELERQIRELRRELEAGRGGVRVASTIRHKFHLPQCEWAAEIDPDNLVQFKNRDAAIEAGLRPCQTCCA